MVGRTDSVLLAAMADQKLRAARVEKVDRSQQPVGPSAKAGRSLKLVVRVAMLDQRLSLVVQAEMAVRTQKLSAGLRVVRMDFDVRQVLRADQKPSVVKAQTAQRRPLERVRKGSDSLTLDSGLLCPIYLDALFSQQPPSLSRPVCLREF